MFGWIKRIFNRRPVVYKNVAKEPVVQLPCDVKKIANLGLEVHNLEGFTEAEKQKYLKSAEAAVFVLNTQNFKDWCLSYKFTSTTLTNPEIYAKIMSGDDIHSPKDNDFDIHAILYYSSKNVVGYTYYNTMKTWINKKFFMIWGIDGVAGNIVHEGMHKLSFNHASATDHSSVPYSVGYFVRDFIKYLLETGRDQGCLIKR